MPLIGCRDGGTSSGGLLRSITDRGCATGGGTFSCGVSPTVSDVDSGADRRAATGGVTVNGALATAPAGSSVEVSVEVSATIIESRFATGGGTFDALAAAPAGLSVEVSADVSVTIKESRFATGGGTFLTAFTGPPVTAAVLLTSTADPSSPRRAAALLVVGAGTGSDGA